MMKTFTAAGMLCLAAVTLWAQSTAVVPTPDQLLRGSNSPQRSCYDVYSYFLNLFIDVERRALIGSNTITYDALSDFDTLQLDLFSNLTLDSIIAAGQRLTYRRLHNSVFVAFPRTVRAGLRDSLTVFYRGSPLAARKPPWQGGFVWKKDAQGRPWVGVACQGLGASVWFPCKDQLADEPTKVWLRCTADASLTCVSNGRLLHRKTSGQLTSWLWHVSYPINIYNITLNLAHYAHFSDRMIFHPDTLTLDYYVLDYNLVVAQSHLQQSRTLLTCFSERFGPYPFLRDGFKLVETPYWGMEHQSAISYGNDFINNKWGFDFILVHETAHEWWGNHFSASDYADLWLHEGFGTYAETVYLECCCGDSLAREYLSEQMLQIRNQAPLVGPRGVNHHFSDNDIYYKGAWVIHTFRNALNNDSLFFALLKGLQQTFGQRTLLTEDFISYINAHTGADWTPFFRQYLFASQPPTLVYRIHKKGKGTRLSLRWEGVEAGFSLPVAVADSYRLTQGVVRRTYRRLPVTTEWSTWLLPDIKPAAFRIERTGYFFIEKREK
ncbi:MAG: M1 family metallopeptidase [Chitinophagales bacterium]|nr:M1 family metallopeptidase [Chitinophagales bacterium]MDW8393397.1 M1 family metallopeptidase [Chitinophagales bacterium]